MKTTPSSEYEVVDQPDLADTLAEEVGEKAARERSVARLRLLWDQRRLLWRVTAYGLVAFTLIAFLIPKRYESTARLMPPDTQSSSSLAMMAALSARTGGLGGFAGDLLGLKGSGALFVDILRSRTVQDRLIEGFDLKEVYGIRVSEDARRRLSEDTSISEDRKSGIITITVTDKDPQRATAMAQAYVGELNRLVAEVSTSAARRERVFLEERLKVVKQELDQAAREFSVFASKNTAIDIKEQGRAMVEAAATLAGQLIAAQTELEGLRQVYSDNNVRVRAARARIAELQRQLEKLGGTDASITAGNPGGDLLYPSIRKLPLLGVTYADLFRRTKIAEAVYETLTQQFELAKVQEAKETPSVKVLDAANLPEKKSFPPRLVIMFLGTFFAFAFGAVWILARARWAEIDSQDAGKIFAQEIFTTLKAQTLWASQNGSRLHGTMGKIWSRLSRRKNQPEVSEEGPK
jgi:capsule polysaccharide export protein KpsE/RkpR